MRSYLTLFLKGVPIGISNILPGVSGGTVALILNIYELLIKAVKEINLRILIPLFIGGVSGIYVTASLVTYFMEAYPTFINSLIFGLIIASAKITYVEIKYFNFKNIFFGISALLLAIFLSINAHITATETSVNLINIAIGGVFSSISMLLPGISGATILIILGVYKPVLVALAELNFLIISVFSLSALLGIICCAWIISYILNNHRNLLMTILTGLILGSSTAVIPYNLGVNEILGVLLGILLVTLFSYRRAKLVN
ncbi:hypothetical protein SYNTR_0850 [Candidatus Syntrophocurvum alkaliphilum]|uniref:DUF368 domain-containing protein n=1 Tax=Candidatus Syntrophocurvum alkaliphilum TaxID=2293317 RepID=A0A6I6DGH6_9FIRM|nr:DUF368 domain-containing protein [Candidatus Syntrophocurvum alkaliphilum]QGT99443.1 hypothetical protein SYNTR_0850 [Candidatus Syntrophocurvum alkaliphilum]